MRRLQEVFTYELRRNLRRKGFLFATFGIPLLMFILPLGFHLYTQVTADPDSEDDTAAALLEQLDFEAIETAGIVDPTNVFATIPDSLEDVILRYDDVEAARTALNAGEIDVFYDVQPDYIETGNVVIHVPRLQVNLLNVAPIEQLFYRTVVGDMDDWLIQRLRNPGTFNEFNLSVEGGESSQNGRTDQLDQVQFWFVYAFVIIFMMAITLTNNYLMQSVVQERENRTIEILLSSLSPNDLLTGKVLAMSTLGIIQMLVWFSAAIASFQFTSTLATFEGFEIFSLAIPYNLLPIAAVFFVLTYVFYASMFATIGTLSNSVQEGAQYVGFFILPLLVPMYLMPIMQNNPNGILALFISFFPLVSPTGMIARMLIVDVPVWQVGASAMLVLVLTIFGLWMAGRVFRVHTLLSGKAPKLKELPRLLFGDGLPARKAKESSG